MKISSESNRHRRTRLLPTTQGARSPDSRSFSSQNPRVGAFLCVNALLGHYQLSLTGVCTSLRRLFAFITTPLSQPTVQFLLLSFKGSTDGDAGYAPLVAQGHISWLANDCDNGRLPEGVAGRFRNRGRTILISSLHVSILDERVMKSSSTLRRFEPSCQVAIS
jgi:hypothetical protein